jgi:hypothetical protein
MWWAQYSDARTDDPAKAAAVVWQVTKRGTDFSMFGSYTSGRAQQYYNRPHNGFPAVRPLVQRYLRGFTATAIRR